MLQNSISETSPDDRDLSAANYADFMRMKAINS
jgi:hypothetical protein